MPAARRLADLLLRPFAGVAAKLRRRSGKRGPGAHAIALTPEGKLILIRLRYARGWRLPGGGRSEKEDLTEAALRELREEIGMTSHGKVRPLAAIDPALILVEDVVYEPRRWTWEVERVIEADAGTLPPGMSPLARRWIARFNALG